MFIVVMFSLNEHLKFVFKRHEKCLLLNFWFHDVSPANSTQLVEETIYYRWKMSSVVASAFERWNRAFELSILLPRSSGASSRNADALIDAQFVIFRRESGDNEFDVQGLCEVFKYEPAWNLFRAMLNFVFVPEVHRFATLNQLIELNGEAWS